MSQPQISLGSELVKESSGVWVLRSTAVPKEQRKLTPTQRTAFYSLKRLHRDYKECLANPLPTVVARPIDDSNFYEWHGNIRGSPGTVFENSNFHITINFPQDYPKSPPRIFMKSGLKRQHIYGEWICLDMLEGWIADKMGETRQDQYYGWTSAYTVQSILIQLQAYLFQEDELYDTQTSIHRAKRYRCPHFNCAHTNDNPFPPYGEELKDYEDSDGEEPDPVVEDDPDPVVEDDPEPIVEDDPEPNGTEREATKSTQTIAPKPKSVASLSSSAQRRNRRKKNRQRRREAGNGDVTGNSASGDSGRRQSHQEPFKSGHELVGVITRLEQNFAFVDIGSVDGMDGFLHISQIRNGFVENIEDELQLNQEIKCWILDHKGQRYNLTMKRPKRKLKTVVKGEKFEGLVKQIKPFGAYVSIGLESDALLLVSELGNQVVWDIYDVLEVDMKIPVRVISVEPEKNRINVKLVRKKQPALTSKVPNCILNPDYGYVPDDVLAIVFGYLHHKHYHTIRGICPRFARVADLQYSREIIRNELVCFHSKQSYTHQTLGLGLTIERFPNGGLQRINPTLDPIGLSAWFNEGQRMGVWKEPFTHWLPLYINKFHGKRAIPRAKEAMSLIYHGGEPGGFSWRHALKILTTLMNTMVVTTQKGELHESVVALQGYCAFYHLLLAFCEEYPQIQEHADKKIIEFLRDETYRSKKSVPDLGQWIIYLSISDKYGWRHAKVARAYLLENFDRNAKWIIIKYTKLGSFSHDRDADQDGEDRLAKSLEATEVSRRLLMFQVYFLKLFRHNPLDGSVIPVADVKKKLDFTFGRPTRGMEEQLQAACKQIKDVDTWEGLFEWIGVPCPSKKFLVEWLRTCVKNSERRGYHKMFYILRDAGRLKKPKKKEPEFIDGHDQLLDAYDDGDYY